MLRFVRVGLLSLVAALSACHVQTEVAVTLDEDGSGRVDVAVGLDADALDVVSDPEALLITNDLDEAGWTVSVPTLEPDGFTWVRASKLFGSPAEAEVVLAEVTGGSGAVQEVSLSRSDSFTATTYSFDAVADLSGGLELFSDDDLAEALDGEPLGESVEAVEERFGAPISELFSLTVTVDLPGDAVDTSSSDGTLWRPVVGGDPVMMSASSEIVDTTPFIWLGAAAVSLVIALGIVVWRVVRHRRRPDEPSTT